MIGNETFLLDLPNGVEHLLRSAHGKGGDDHAATPVKGALNMTGKGCHRIGRFVHSLSIALMEAIAVGGFDHYIICFVHRFGIVDNGLVGIAHITGEDDLSGFES